MCDIKCKPFALKTKGAIHFYTHTVVALCVSVLSTTM